MIADGFENESGIQFMFRRKLYKPFMIFFWPLRAKRIPMAIDLLAEFRT